VDSEGRTAMIAACYMGHMDCVRELIIWGADIEVTDQVIFTFIVDFNSIENDPKNKKK
jgi:hypothetical protein